ncbi:MAG TPA: SEC-C domain-containing protein [Verrucomicrobiae bacterium]|jgi:hypothetical protein|nr:SEC-C domain-containing protein [Verrucomicrobiae bacterium]
MSEKIRRNDPCHCGSGKKYKHCHLDLDAAAHRSNGASHVEKSAPAATPPPSAAVTLAATLETLKELQSVGGAKQQKEIQKMLERAEPLNAYLSREGEIQAAIQALESHQQEFTEFANDTKAFQDRVEALFAEKGFAGSRFTIEALQQVFDKFGSPLGVAKEKLPEHLRTLILHLADKEYRTAASINLLLKLPDLVAAGRVIDACLVLSCGRITNEEPQTANPFLWQMFVHSYQAWTAAKQARLGA